MSEPIGVTFFTDAYARSATEAHLSLGELQARVMSTTAPSKAELPWLKLALFGTAATPIRDGRGGSLRNNANVLFICGVEADYDADVMPPADAVVALERSGLAGLVYTSPSHSATRNRWRVLCPTSEWLPPDARRALVGRLNAVLGGVLSTESFTLSQAYFYGSVAGSVTHGAWVVAGRCIDLATDLTAEAYPAPVRPVAVPVLSGGLPPDQHALAALERAAAMLQDPAATGQRHPTLLAAALLLAPMVKSGHIAEGVAVSALHDAMEASGRTPNDGEVESAVAGAARFAIAYAAPTGGSEFTPPPVVYLEPEMAELTEDAAALAFADTHAERFRYDVTAGGSGRDNPGAWFVFRPGDGWRLDDTAVVSDAARVFVRAARAQRGFNKSTMGAASVGFANAVVRFCRTDPRMVMTAAGWDSDQFTLGVPGGSVDLRTGVLTAAAPGMFIRRRTRVAPAERADCPTWLRFLDQATAGRQDFAGWLWRWAGYCLTGDMREESFAFVHGTGGNGKSVFLGTVAAVMGDYAITIPPEVIRADSKVNREVYTAKLDGARLVTASETDQGHALAESFIKELTGNEGPLSARRLYAQPFEFLPVCKLVISGNHAPVLRGRTEAMERRMRVVPFINKPPVPDPELKAKLVAEYPAILRWLIDGAIAWQRTGLGACGAVTGASSAYFADQDTISLWAAERCAMGPGEVCPARVLLEDFNTWLRARGEKPVDARGFKEAVSARLPDVVSGKASVSVYRGIALRTSDASEFTDSG